VSDPWIGAATLSLQESLAEAAQEKTRLHWEKYLKGTATFRGVPMAGIRSAVRETLAHAPDLTTKQLLLLAARWFTQPWSEDKLAAVLLIAEHAFGGLDEEDVPALAEPLASGAISDWNVCDWYATKALHGFVARDIARRGPLIAARGDADTLWQRRAGVVSFVKLAAQAGSGPPGLVDLVSMRVPAISSHAIASRIPGRDGCSVSSRCPFPIAWPSSSRVSPVSPPRHAEWLPPG
jgi:3-methyladenine DNA glycosylase AlkD